MHLWYIEQIMYTILGLSNACQILCSPEAGRNGSADLDEYFFARRFSSSYCIRVKRSSEHAALPRPTQNPELWYDIFVLSFHSFLVGESLLRSAELPPFGLWATGDRSVGSLPAGRQGAKPTQFHSTIPDLSFLLPHWGVAKW